MTWADAGTLLNAGKRVRRACWAAGNYIRFIPGSGIQLKTHAKPTSSWTAHSTSVRAKDWEIAP